MDKKFLYLKYINIPNLLTSISLAIGFITLILMINENFKVALTLYSFTILLDRLDGFIARKLEMTSDFGKELDSLTDFYNFCILPSAVAYLIGFNSILAIVLMVIYINCGVSRLCHFNLSGMEEINGENFFSGIPTTVAASWFLIIVSLLQGVIKFGFSYIMFLFFIAFSILMVAPLKFNKNGLFVKMLYFLIPTALIVLWCC